VPGGWTPRAGNDCVVVVVEVVEEEPASEDEDGVPVSDAMLMPIVVVVSGRDGIAADRLLTEVMLLEDGARRKDDERWKADATNASPAIMALRATTCSAAVRVADTRYNWNCRNRIKIWAFKFSPFLCSCTASLHCLFPASSSSNRLIPYAANSTDTTMR